MEVILREDIDKLGTRGQVIKVAAGYARNFLLPKRLAVTATASNKKIIEQERQSHLRKDAKLEVEAQDLARLVNSVTVTIKQKAGENDQLFAIAGRFGQEIPYRAGASALFWRTPALRRAPPCRLFIVLPARCAALSAGLRRGCGPRQIGRARV